MRICVNCGNEYPKSISACPFCGYPEILNRFPYTEYSARLESRFDLIRKRANNWILWDDSRQRKISCRQIPKGTEGDQIMELLDLLNHVEDPSPYPRLLEVSRNGSREGYYLTEHVSGISLSQILQRQNPPLVSWTDRIARQLYSLMIDLLNAPIFHGSLSLDNLVIRADGRVLPDGYGKQIILEPEEDILQIFRIMIRLYSGEWMQVETSERIEPRIEHIREKTLAMQPGMMRDPTTGYVLIP